MGKMPSRLSRKPLSKNTVATPSQKKLAQWLNEGLGFHKQGLLAEAKLIYERILVTQPNHFDALHLLGVIALQTKNYQLAIELISKAIQINPNVAAAHSNRGNALKGLKQFAHALASYNKAISLKPEYADAWLNRGNALQQLNQCDQALASYNKAISLKPEYADVWLNRGNALQELNQYDQALASYNKAISLKPDYVDAWLNRGTALQQLEQYDQALSSYNKAISLKPEYADAWSNRGVTLQELKQYDQALASYDKAISLKPGYTDAWLNRGNTLKDIGCFSLAEASYREAIQLDPEFLDARSNLVLSLNYGEKLSTQDALAEAKSFGLKVSERAQPKFTDWEVPAIAKKLRIGFVSGDLSSHPVGYFVEGLLEQLDKSQFEIFAFPTTSSSDELTQRIKPFFNEWMPVFGMSDQAAATLINQKGIHVLIDLSGHTAHNRLAVFSYKPAPVQVSWLGLPMTTGVPEMDYVLGDPHALPQEFDNQFTEALWRLPEIYLCLTPPSEHVEVGLLPAMRNQYITFGSFNNLSKMNDNVVKVWSNILEVLPNSRLLLKTKQLCDPNVCSQTQNRFKVHGITAERLVLKGTLNARADHLSVYNEIDIALDTFFYPGVTTSAEALWMGAPVLSLGGNNFLSCTAKSIADNVGLNDWIAADVDDYVNKAVQFASDLDRLAQMRSMLRERVLRSPLFDTPRFARNFEEALWGMWNSCPQSKRG